MWLTRFHATTLDVLVNFEYKLMNYRSPAIPVMRVQVEAEDTAHVAADEARAEQYWADGVGPASLITPAKARASLAQPPSDISPTLSQEARVNARDVSDLGALVGHGALQAFLPASLQAATTPSPASNDENESYSSSSMVDSFRQWHSQQVQSLSPQQTVPTSSEPPLPAASATSNSPYTQQPVFSATNTPFGSAKKPPRTPVSRVLPPTQPRSHNSAASHASAATPVRPAIGSSSPGGLFSGFGGVSPIPTSNFKEGAAAEALNHGEVESLMGAVATPAREKAAASYEDPFALGLHPLNAESPILAASPLMPAERVFWSPGGGRVNESSPSRGDIGHGGGASPEGSNASFRFGGGGGNKSPSLGKSAVPRGEGWGTPPGIHSSWAADSSDWPSGSLSYSSGGGSSDSSPRADGRGGDGVVSDFHEELPPSPPQSIRSRRPRVNRSLFDDDNNHGDNNEIESGHQRRPSSLGRNDSQSLHRCVVTRLI